MFGFRNGVAGVLVVIATPLSAPLLPADEKGAQGTPNAAQQEHEEPERHRARLI